MALVPHWDWSVREMTLLFPLRFKKSWKHFSKQVASNLYREEDCEKLWKLKRQKNVL